MAKHTIESIKTILSPRGIRMIGAYINNKVKTLFECEKGHQYQAIPGNVFKGDGCKQCANDKHRRSKEDINKQIEHTGIQMIGDYSTIKIKTLFKCSSGHEWKAKPNDILNGKGCPLCSPKAKYTLQEFIDAAKNTHGDKYDYSLVQYESMNKEIRVICREHGEFFISPNNHLYKKMGCRNCRPTSSRIADEWINNLNIDTLIREYRLKENNKQPVDAYDPVTNTIYQFHGNYWHGNPLLYEATMMNEIAKKTMGELYSNTIESDRKIREWGYNLVVMWENEYESTTNYRRKLLTSITHSDKIEQENKHG